MSILIFFIILSVLVIVHELGHFLVAKKNGVYVEEFGFGLPPRLFGKKIGETIYSLNWLPFGGFVKVLGEEEAQLREIELSPEMRKRTFASKSPRVKLAILCAGVLFNFILGWGIISYLFTQGVPVPTGKVAVDQIAKDSPAEKAGIKKGDIIVSLSQDKDKKIVTTSDELVAATDHFLGKEITIHALRGSQEYDTVVTPRVKPPKGEGALGVVISSEEIKKYSLLQAPVLGLAESVKMTGFMARELGRMAHRAVTLQKSNIEVAGPVGIYFITAEAAAVGFKSILQLLGLLSLNLAIINILPFPALDGGRVAIVLYEWVRGRKVNPDFERRLNITGFVILISIVILITIHDILKLIN